MFLEDFHSRRETRKTSARRQKLNKRSLTYQVIGGDDDATGEKNSRRDSVVRPEDHVVDDRLVDQVSHLDEPGDRRDQAKHGHFRSICNNQDKQGKVTRMKIHRFHRRSRSRSRASLAFPLRSRLGPTARMLLSLRTHYARLPAIDKTTQIGDRSSKKPW